MHEVKECAGILLWLESEDGIFVVDTFGHVLVFSNAALCRALLWCFGSPVEVHSHSGVVGTRCSERDGIQAARSKTHRQGTEDTGSGAFQFL